nr:TPA: NADH dehydrogenase subunit 5 [Holtodrilus truncatus]
MKTRMFNMAPSLLMLFSTIPFSMFLYCSYMDSMLILEWKFLNFKVLTIPMMILIDKMGMIFSTTVLFISSNVLMFSKFYMEGDKFINRFTMLVLLFILSMNLLIITPHLIMILLGWDGLGITSFILVIYYQNSKSLAAGMITALSNRIGDVFILMAIALSLNSGHWFIFSMWDNNMSTLEIMLIMVAAMTKSAQVPFSSWLPAAMAAPTPVSALVHSSTLVTAGVFMLIRFYPFLSQYYMFNLSLMTLSMITLIMAGLCAMLEMDMKKIIALSTLSQLGLMMLSLAMDMPMITFMHLIMHALFKALLFICAGSLINMHNHSQDMRWMGNLSHQLPLTTSAMILSSITMSGMPFLSAFYSKDLILEMSINTPNKFMVVTILYLSLIITSMYSMRLIFSIVMTPMLSSPYFSLSEIYTLNPMFNLSMMTIISGSMFTKYFMNLNLHPIPLSLMMTPLIFMSFGILFSIMFVKTMHMMKNKVMLFLTSMWFLTPMSTQFIMPIPFTYSKMSLEYIDNAWLEFFGGPMFIKNFKFAYSMKSMFMMYNPINLLWSSIAMGVLILICM